VFRSTHLLQCKSGSRGTSRPGTAGLDHGHVLGDLGLDACVPQLSKQFLIVAREEERHELIFVDFVGPVLVDAVKDLLCLVPFEANGLGKMAQGRVSICSGKPQRRFRGARQGTVARAQQPVFSSQGTVAAVPEVLE
jgi:hypothetical protein